MTDGNNTGETPTTFSKEEVTNLLAEQKIGFDKAIEDQKAHITKLNEENKNKRLSHKEIIEALSIDKVEGKTDIELVNEKLAGFETAHKGLLEELAKERDAKELMSKKSSVEKKAQAYNFHNVDDVMKFVDINGDVDEQLKTIAETKAYLVRQEVKQVGQTFNGSQKKEEHLSAQEKALKAYQLNNSKF